MISKGIPEGRGTVTSTIPPIVASYLMFYGYTVSCRIDLLGSTCEEENLGLESCPLWCSPVPMTQNKMKLSYQKKAVQNWAISSLLPQQLGSVGTRKATVGTKMVQALLGLREAPENEEKLTRLVTSLIQVNDLPNQLCRLNGQ